MRTINISALVLRGDSRLGGKRQRIALRLQSGIFREESPVIMARPDVVGFQTLAALLGGTDEDKPIRVSLEADVPDKPLTELVSSDIVVKTIYAI